MSEIVKFDYRGDGISFEFADGNRMINATEMARPFGKPVANFLRLGETKRYVELLELRYSDVNIGESLKKCSGSSKVGSRICKAPGWKRNWP